jgi:hypothetical protein
VDTPGQKFLSCAGFALDEDRGVCSGYLLGLSEDLFHRKTLAYDFRVLT